MNNEQNVPAGGGQPASAPQQGEKMEFEMSKMSKGAKWIFVGSIITIVAMFLPWYGSSGTEVFGNVVGRFSLNGFHGVGYLVVLAAIVAIVIAIMPAIGRKVPEMKSLTVPALQLILGGVVVLFALIRILTFSTVSFFGVGVGIKFGGFVAVVGGIIMLLGAWMDYRESKKTRGEVPAPSGPTDASGGVQA